MDYDTLQSTNNIKKGYVPVTWKLPLPGNKCLSDNRQEQKEWRLLGFLWLDECNIQFPK